MFLDQERSLVLLSGYYGFDNLGDEAILEELCNELKELVAPECITVLSARPQATAERYGVRAISRTDPVALLGHLRRARLFISGGGGLFQNTRNLRSILFYGLQIALAKLNGAAVMVYAQGVGPLKGTAALSLSRTFFRMADVVTVRDNQSHELLQSWGVEATRTADPVWSLKESDCPVELRSELQRCSPVVALSLREAPDLSAGHIDLLAELLNQYLEKQVHILLLPLQKEQDLPPLRRFHARAAELRRHCSILDTSMLQRPSQWVSLLRHCRGLVGMRLHALILSLKADLPVAGIAYDPKVKQVMDEFEQPYLILTKQPAREQWAQAVKSFVYEADTLRNSAAGRLKTAQNLSCQNFTILARMLNMQRGC